MKPNKQSMLKKITIVMSVLLIFTIGLFLFTSPPPDIELEKDLVTQDIQINDTVGQHELTGRLWALPNTDDKSQIKGIVLISHGFSSRAESMVLYASTLAKAGYIVAGVTHDDIPLLKTGEVINDPMLARQRHLALLLEQVYTKVDNPNIRNLPVGLLGYSLGSFSVLNASGLQANFANQESYCKTELGQQNIIMCNPRFSGRMDAIKSVNNVSQSSLHPNAVAVLAPAYTALFDKSFFDDYNIPSLMVYGELDEYVNVEEIEAFAQSSQVFNHTQAIDGAGHYVYLPACSFCSLVSIVMT